MNNTTVLGIVKNQEAAEIVLTDLVRAGFARDDLSVLFPGAGDSRELALEKGNMAAEGAVAGGGAGGVVGGVIGMLAGLGALAIPGLGLFMVAGPILGALSGVTLGAAVGSVAGGLIGMGVPEVHARIYERAVNAGSALIAVHTETEEHVKAARVVLETHGAEHVLETTEIHVPDRKRRVA